METNPSEIRAVPFGFPKSRRANRCYSYQLSRKKSMEMRTMRHREDARDSRPMLKLNLTSRRAMASSAPFSSYSIVIPFYEVISDGSRNPAKVPEESEGFFFFIVGHLIGARGTETERERTSGCNDRPLSCSKRIVFENLSSSLRSSRELPLFPRSLLRIFTSFFRYATL